MNKMLLVLLLVVFMAVGSLLFFSSDEAPVVPVQPTDKTATQKKEAPALTDAERDTYANTIKTMNARNNELMRPLPAKESEREGR